MFKKRIKVYVAGKYSGFNVIEILQNIGRGKKVCAELFKLGYAPFCPWHDASYSEDNPSCRFTVNDFYEYSIEWLRASDAVFMTEGWQHSRGARNELKEAKLSGIPIAYNLSDLKEIELILKNNKCLQGTKRN